MSAVGVLAAFPFASGEGESVVNPPTGPVNVGLMVTKTTVTAADGCSSAGVSDVGAGEAEVSAAALDDDVAEGTESVAGEVTSAVVTAVSSTVV